MIDYLHKILTLNVVEDLWQSHCEEMKKFGFDRLIHGFTHYSTDTSVGPREDALVLSSHESEYFRKYMEDRHYEHAPLTHWAMQNTGAISWRIIGEMYEGMSPREKEVVALNKANGVIAGYSISFREVSARTRGITALTARPGLSQTDVDAIWDEHGKEIEVACHVMHLKLMSIPHSGLRPSLSPRQIEVLEWVADGKTNQDIATIMGLSLATVEKHLRLAREKLDVETTAQAVMKAAFQNQMFVI